MLIEGVGDERVVVLAATTRFAPATEKSDTCGDDDNSAGEKRLREYAYVEDERISAARTRLADARETLLGELRDC